ncbi:transposase, partial [Jeotgalicoccus huakuii]|nr:transposase [Jeotgalicoccus huakuii]
LVESNVIPELEREADGPLTPEEIANIHTQLSDIEAKQTERIEHTGDVSTRKAIRAERSKIRQSKKEMKDYLDRRLKYQSQRLLMRERNSYSKTDPDATFMRMKDDHMQNGQLKAGYNLQIATNHQYVLGYDIFWNPTDTRTLDPFLSTMQHRFQHLPTDIVADAGYGSESNYECVVDKYERQPLIPYNTYYKEQKKNYLSNEMQSNHWEYNEVDDYYVCPNNRRLPFKRHTSRTDKYGYQRIIKIYECEDCRDCPLMALCKSSTTDRPKQIQKNMNLEYFKAQVKQTLSSPEGRHRYAQRKIDVETTFGNLKANLGFTRMSVRGHDAVHNELGIALMAVNLRK